MADAPLEAGRLPVVEEYDLPREFLPSRAHWALEADRVALLIHDVQRYFLRIYPPGSRLIAEVLRNVAALRKRCDELGIPVFYTAQTPHQDPRERGLQADLWGPGMGADPEDAEIASDVSPGEGHEVLQKWRYSAFQRSTLHSTMTADGRDQLIVTGVYANIGCLLTAADAFMRDVQPFFIVDAVADFTAARHVAAVDYVAQHCGQTMFTSELLGRL
ncbi:MAG: isochorismatase family protein [Gemmatimonadetes bacterium]|nr:isochorismatase family protein [Gemmatimonadota bacterium]